MPPVSRSGVRSVKPGAQGMLRPSLWRCLWLPRDAGRVHGDAGPSAAPVGRLRTCGGRPCSPRGAAVRHPPGSSLVGMSASQRLLSQAAACWVSSSALAVTSSWSCVVLAGRARTCPAVECALLSFTLVWGSGFLSSPPLDSRPALWRVPPDSKLGLQQPAQSSEMLFTPYLIPKKRLLWFGTVQKMPFSETIIQLPLLRGNVFPSAWNLIENHKAHKPDAQFGSIILKLCLPPFGSMGFSNRFYKICFC